MEFALLEALSYEEAQRILEVYFSHFHPYTCTIETSGISSEYETAYFQLVEKELLLRGEKIYRDGAYFKILKDQKKSLK